jgi:hypothetical protein
MSDLNYKKLLEITNKIEFVDYLTNLNQLYETTFKFQQLNENDLKFSLIKTLQKWLEECIDDLQTTTKPSPNFNCICSCLNAIRILSRDKDLSFNNEEILIILQKLAGLNDEPTCTQNQITKLNFLNLNNLNQNQEIVNLSLKSMANLIYNSSFAQIFYAKTNLIDIITNYIKDFNMKFYTNNITICTFNIRLLFLLTIFNRSLCLKLKDNFHILTYLIEIIDQIIKDNLNDKRSKINNTASSSSKNNHVEMCYLKSIDIDYLIELLKLLYNLTMDKKESTKMSIEEYEAHLMRLVSILRDLLTCKEEILNSIDENQMEILSKQQNKSKLDDLHSNIINLLLNMPLFCFEELLIPLDSSENNKQVIKKTVKNTKRFNNNNKKTQFLDNSDYDFEGKNLEAINIILQYLKKCLNLYLKSNNNNNNQVLNIKNPEFIVDHLQPVLLLLTVISKSNCVIRKFCRLKVLPPLGEEVFKLPTEGNCLRNQLVCLMTDMNLHIKRLTEQFLYVLCKENVGRLIKYTGFGNAAGLIADIGFLKLNLNKDTKDVDAYSTDSESSDTEEYERIKDYVNQVTGRYEKDRKSLFDGLSEEQKECIAHELMCGIDKLSKIGVIKPAGIDESGKLVEISHVLEVPDYIEKIKGLKINQKSRSDSENEVVEDA